MSRLSSFTRRRLNRYLRHHGYRIDRQSRISFFEPMLWFCLKRCDMLQIIQIGANDGKESDPISEFIKLNHKEVRAIVIEPIREYYEQLKCHYAGFPNVIPVNTAIHNTEKEMTLYRVDPTKASELPNWAKGIASFDSRHHEKSGIPSEALLAEKVPCVTIGELLEEYQIAHVGLLQIDTEGYDAEILRGFNFDRIRPKLIRFEHGLAEGVMSRDTFSSVRSLLHQYDYELMIEHHDATAYQFDLMC